jgi:hypothetical protein
VKQRETDSLPVLPMPRLPATGIGDRRGAKRDVDKLGRLVGNSPARDHEGAGLTVSNQRRLGDPPHRVGRWG